jgi:primosomal protein N' (replication factor Y)
MEARALTIAQVEPMTTARALRGPFDYRLSEELRGGVDVGSMLVVPFGRRQVLGVVVGMAEHSEVAEDKLLEPLRALELGVPVDLVALAEWIAAEYCSTIARALTLVLPPGAARRLSGRKRRTAIRRTAHLAVGARAKDPPQLTPEQQAVLDDLPVGTHAQRLLHGVTGSGKTEIYLRATALALRQGKGAIVLVPEIALTPQIVSRFLDRFGDTVAVMHSRLRPGERYEEWRRLRSGEARVCVGPRSAVFAPIERLGLIVLDEEHDASYKHEGDPRYDARDVAARRARDCGALLLLGSATPRPESRHGVTRLRLPRRVDGAVAAGERARYVRRAPRPASPHRAGARRRPPGGAQGDRPAQPPWLVELSFLSLVRRGVGLPVLRCCAGDASFGGPSCVSSLRSPRAGAGGVRLRLDYAGPPRGWHRAPGARPCRGARRRRRIPGLPPRC